MSYSLQFELKYLIIINMAKRRTLDINVGRCEGIHGHLTCNGRAAGVLVTLDQNGTLILKTPHGLCQAEVNLDHLGRRAQRELYAVAQEKLGKYPAEIRRPSFREGEQVYSFGNPEAA